MILKKYKTVLSLIPWILLLGVLLLWSLGVEMPSFNRQRAEIRNTLVIIERIEELGRLELVKYNFREIYDYHAISQGKLKSSTSLSFYDFSPDLKVALIASGEAVGCIDLRDLREEDMLIRNDSLFIRLPEPELCYHKLDMENTRVYDFERSGFWSNIFPDDEEVTRTIEKAYREAEKQIRNSALQNGILDQTLINAEKVLGPVLERISGKKVIFVYSPAEMELKMK